MNEFLYFVVSIVVSISTFLVGWYLGKRDRNQQLQQIVKAHNIDRVLDGRIEGEPKLFVENGEVKGSVMIKGYSTSSISVINWEKKKVTDEQGERDMTFEEIEKYRPKKSPI